jgi:hypothetical protein
LTKLRCSTTSSRQAHHQSEAASAGITEPHHAANAEPLVAAAGPSRQATALDRAHQAEASEGIVTNPLPTEEEEVAMFDAAYELSPTSADQREAVRC